MNTQPIKLAILFLSVITSCHTPDYQTHYVHGAYLKELFGEQCNDFLGLRFFLDTITIKDPCMAVYNDDLYVMPADYAQEFASRPNYREGIKIFHILPHNIRQDILNNEPNRIDDFSSRALSQLHMAGSGHGLYNPDTYNNGQLELLEEIGGIEFYRFKKQPSRFIVELVWYDAQRYVENPYGPNYIPIISESSVKRDYANKLDSLESVPTIPGKMEDPHYVLTVEPLYSRKVINEYIKENEPVEKWGPFVTWRPWLFPKWYVRKYCFPDLV